MLVLPIGCTLAAGCSNEVLRATLRSAELPDCRAYELVSPAAKDGWLASLVSADGSHAVLKSLGGFAGSSQAALVSMYLSERSSGLNNMGEGWKTNPFSEFGNLEILETTENLIDENSTLDTGVFEARQVPEGAPAERNIYLRGLPNGVPIEIGHQFPPATLASARPSLQDLATLPSVSSNLGTVLFEIAGPTLSRENNLDYLWPGDGTVANSGPLDVGQGFLSLYEYRSGGGSAPALVGINDSGEQISQCGTSLGLPAVSQTTPPKSGFAAPTPADLYNAISENGSRVFFTVAKATLGQSGNACTGEGTGSGPPADELFAHVLVDSETGHEHYATQAISNPFTNAECTSNACRTAPPGDAAFQGASRGGSKVFFLSTRQLTDDASEDSAPEDSAASQAGCPGAVGSNGCNLYEYDANSPEGHNLVAVSAGDFSGLGPKVQGVARVSEDGSHVYFVAHGVLTGAANPMGDHPQPGEDNLYVYDSETRGIAFVGTLSEADARDWSVEDARPVSASPDGRFFVFTSSADLTRDDTSSVAQVFEYDAAAKTLVRVSVGQNGFGNNGNTGVYPASIVSGVYMGHQNGAPELTSISDDGSVVVFQSSDALTPEAAAGSPNVYEFRAGHVSSISDGQSVNAGQGNTPTTSLLGMDGSAQDIYFETATQLVPQDGDTQVDIYDARIDGGFAPARSAECAGEECRGALSPTPVLSSVGSVDQLGGEQVAEPLVHSAVKAKPKLKKKSSIKKSTKKKKKKKASTKRRILGRKTTHGTTRRLTLGGARG